jgi:hypothetical protein
LNDLDRNINCEVLKDKAGGDNHTNDGKEIFEALGRKDTFTKLLRLTKLA